MLPAVNHHPELRAPVADVIVANDVVPKKLRDPGERVAEHHAANMADMHRLGDVRRTEVDHDAVALFRQRRRPRRSSCKSSRRLRRDRRRLESKIDKTGAGDRGRFATIPRHRGGR